MPSCCRSPAPRRPWAPAPFGFHPHCLLSGFLLPLSLGPGWLRVPGHVNPMYYAVQAARDLAAGAVATGAVGAGFAVTAAVTGLAVCWGTRSYQRAMG